MGLLDLGLIGIVLFIVLFIVLIPVIATILVGIGFANWFGFTGWTWWGFLIVFYLVVSAVLGACVK